MQTYHDGICGGHLNGIAIAKHILRIGYYWPTMERDSQEYIKKCFKCE